MDNKIKLNITGMTCSACVSRVEKAIRSVPGVSEVSVSLLTNSAQVEGEGINLNSIISNIKKAGYNASIQGQKEKLDDSPQKSNERELTIRMALSAAVLLVLMYFSMFQMWGAPLPTFFDGNHIAKALVQFILCTIIIVINKRFFINGAKSVIHKSPNMDTLISLGSGISFLWSIFALFMMTKADPMVWMDQLHFESASMILVYISIGKLLEAKAKGKTTDALKSLVKLAPKTVKMLKGDEEVSVQAEDIKPGDIIVIRPGERICVDGEVIFGESAVDESAISGESLPVAKTVGCEVLSGTLNQSGILQIKATKTSGESTLAGIIKMVTEASASKAPIAKLADKVSAVFVPVVLAIATVTTIIWLILGKDFGSALQYGISVLVVSCPCALGLATPVAIMVGNGKAGKNGILFKTAEALENTGKVNIAVFDKTGTITTGKPVVADIYSADNKKELLSLAYSIEKNSEHPLAKAIVEYAKKQGTEAIELSDWKNVPGFGVSAKYEGKEIFAGSLNFIRQMCIIDERVEEFTRQMASSGKTTVLFCSKNKVIGVIALSDSPKEDAKEAIAKLKELGVKTVMLTGDSPAAAKHIAQQVGIDEVHAGVLPDGKLKVIEELKTQGKVAMIGDGINDAPALTAADTGIAIGAGTDIAIDSAEIVLAGSKLIDVVNALRISKATIRNIKQNLFWAFCYNIVGIPLAAGALSSLGLTASPALSAAAMSISSFIVVSNALRLNFFKPSTTNTITPKEEPVKEEKQMEITINVKGMMCSNCERHVKNALEAIDGVTSAVASHTEGNVKVTLSKDVPLETLKKAITDEGYEVE